MLITQVTLHASQSHACCRSVHPSRTGQIASSASIGCCACGPPLQTKGARAWPFGHCVARSTFLGHTLPSSSSHDGEGRWWWGRGVGSGGRVGVGGEGSVHRRQPGFKDTRRRKRSHNFMAALRALDEATGGFTCLRSAALHNRVHAPSFTPRNTRAWF